MGIKFLSFLLTATIFFTTLEVNAKELNTDMFMYGGSSYDSFYGVTTTSDGSIVAVGLTESTNMYDALVVKYDIDGKIDWQKSYSGSNWDEFYGVTATSDGGIVAIGESYSTDIDGLTNKGDSDAVIVKYDENGKIKWQSNYGGSSYDSFRGVTTTNDGGLVAVGFSFSSDIDGLTNENNNGAIIVKYDANGNIEWQKSNSRGNNYEENYFYGVTAIGDGGVVAVGFSGGEEENGLTYNGSFYSIIVKYDAEGNIEWQKDYGGSSSDYFFGVNTTNDGGVVAVGYSASSDIDGLSYYGKYDSIIVKYDSNGNIEWQNSYGGSADDYFSGVTATNDGGVVAIGFSGSTDIDGITNKGKYDAIIVKYDKDGKVMEQKNYGGDCYDYFNGVTKDDDGRVIVVGETESKDIDGLINNGDYDGLVVSISYVYDITKEDTSGGNFDVTQDGSMGKISISPDNGYVLDTITITDTSNNVLPYYYEDGYYYFELNDDVVVLVTFQKIVNPSTGLSNHYMILTLVLSISTIFIIFLRKKKYV